jgi:hypothetical protein
MRRQIFQQTPGPRPHWPTPEEIDKARIRKHAISGCHYLIRDPVTGIPMCKHTGDDCCGPEFPASFCIEGHKRKGKVEGR